MTLLNVTIEGLIELETDLFYNPENGKLYKHKNYQYVEYIDRNGYYRIRYHGKPIQVHLLIHDKLGIDRTGLVVTFLDGDKQNTKAENMALKTRHECNIHHFNLRKQKRLKKLDLDQ